MRIEIQNILIQVIEVGNTKKFDPFLSFWIKVFNLLFTSFPSFFNANG